MCTEFGVPNRLEPGGEDEEEELTAMAPPLGTPTRAGAGAGGGGGGGGGEEELEVETQMGYHAIRDETPSTDLGAESHHDTLAENVEANGNHASGVVLSNNRQSSQERIVTVNGMEFHVYGNVSGLELLSLSDRQESLHLPDSDEEEEEERRRVEAERAILEANRAHEARRAAPMPAEHRTRILNAMKAIDLGGFRPAWADSVPEDQWVHRISRTGNSST